VSISDTFVRLDQLTEQSSNRRTTTINALPNNVCVEIFSLCRSDEVDATLDDLPWKWHRLAHVCRTWRQIIFASSRHLHLELLCTHGTPVKENLSYLPAFPLVISFPHYDFSDSDRDNLISALEHRDRVQIVDLNVPHSLIEELATVMREPFPALTSLRLASHSFSVAIPTLPDTFLAGSAPRLRAIYITDIPFPAAPNLILSAHDLVRVDLREIPPTGYIPPEVMVASLAASPRLEDFTLGFVWGTICPDRIRLPVSSITRTVFPALTIICFQGPLEYFEDLVAQIDAPQLDYLNIEYRDHQDYQIPQLCKFIDRSKKLCGLRHALLLVDPDTITIELQSSFCLAFQEDAIGLVVSQISAMLSNVVRLTINSDCEIAVGLGIGIRWLELFRPFAAVKALIVDNLLSWNIPLALQDVTEERAAEVLPALELLCLKGELKGEPVASLEAFLAARRNLGRPVTVINEEREIRERFKTPDVGE
jgi:hypothetical protein